MVETSGAGVPKPTSDIGQLQRDMDDFGYCLIKDFLSPDEVETLRLRLAEQALAEREAGVAQLIDGNGSRVGAPIGGDEEHGWSNQVIRNLFNKGSCFHPLVLDRRLGAVLEHGFRGRSHYLLSYQGIQLRKGAEAQVIHSDQMWVPDQTSIPYVINTMVMLTDFTEENGATRMHPGSHRFGRYPPSVQKAPGMTGVLGIRNSEPIDTVPAVAPAGTAMVFEGRVWHGAGACQTAADRYSVTLYFGLDFMRQMDNIPACIHPDVYAEMSTDLKDMIGYRAVSLGRIEPQQPGGLTNTNQEWPYTPLMRPRGKIRV